MIDGLEIVRSRHEFDVDVPRMFGKFGGPCPRQACVRVHLEDRLLPRGLM